MNAITQQASFTLTEEQQQAVSLISSWFDKGESQTFRLGGYAGTGKTTVIKDIRAGFSTRKISTAIGAFTGKACHVLHKKGLPASTLHSTLYDVEPLPNGQVEFHLKYKLEGDPALFIIDEASMISTDLYNDLLSFGKKVLFVGDPGQLEPVGDNPNLMKDADFVLSKIHRQAETSPIITFATDTRHGKPLIRFEKDGCIVRNKLLQSDIFLNHDQIICGKNNTRQRLNATIRKIKNLPFASLELGEKIIVLRNNRSYGVFNGMILFVDKIKKEDSISWLCDCHTEDDKVYNNLPIWKLGILDPEEAQKPATFKPKTIIHADYGYAITCHKSQGSEWDSVLVMDEVIYNTDMKRWRYTAITRAAQKLTYCI